MKMIDIVEMLREEKLASGLTYGEIEKKTGHSVSVLKRFLRGLQPHETIKTQTLIDVANFFGYRVEIIIAKETPENA